MKCGIIDIGSNTIRLCVYECEGKMARPIFSKKETVGLAGYVKNGALSKKGIESCVNALQSFQIITDNLHLDRLCVFATASLRNVKNTDEAVRQIYEKTGLAVEVILGREEALLDFSGATRAVEMKRGLLVDIGGGSIELVAYDGGAILQAASMDIGSLSLYSRCVEYFFPTREEREKIRDLTARKLHEVTEFQNMTFRHICGVGGTIRNACKLYNFVNNCPKENLRFPSKAVKELLELFKHPDKEALELLLRVAPDRIHTLIPGMLALKEIVDYFKIEEIQVSPYGVREGYLYDRILEGGRQNDPILRE